MLIILMATIKYVDTTISYCAICDISQSRMQSDVKGLGLRHEIKISEIHAQLRLCRNRESRMCECARESVRENMC